VDFTNVAALKAMDPVALMYIRRKIWN